MLDFLLAALTLLALTALLIVLLNPFGSFWPKGRDVLALRWALGLAGALVLVAIILATYAYDSNVARALVFGVPQQVQQAPSKPSGG